MVVGRPNSTTVSPTQFYAWIQSKRYSIQSIYDKHIIYIDSARATATQRRWVDWEYIQGFMNSTKRIIIYCMSLTDEPQMRNALITRPGHRWWLCVAIATQRNEWDWSARREHILDSSWCKSKSACGLCELRRWIVFMWGSLIDSERNDEIRDEIKVSYMLCEHIHI